MNVCIIGAGATGLVAANELVKKVIKSLYLKQRKTRGLVETLTIGNEKLEVYYHHIFTNDVEIINLIEELDLSSNLMWLEPMNSIYKS